MAAALAHLPSTFTYRQAISAGMNHHRLYALRDAGDIEQIGRGLYRKIDAEIADFDLLEAVQRAPLATMCLLSALARHNLTDAIPSRHELALPRGAWHPQISAPIHWHSFDRDTFDLGRTTTAIDEETEIGLYDAPRTIIDTYRLRSSLGTDTAHEALRRWLRSGGQPNQLLDMTKAFPRARPAILNALEILL
jgi:predicted transcriptional regulator of viral defense system